MRLIRDFQAPLVGESHKNYASGNNAIGTI